MVEAIEVMEMMGEEEVGGVFNRVDEVVEAWADIFSSIHEGEREGEDVAMLEVSGGVEAITVEVVA